MSAARKNNTLTAAQVRNVTFHSKYSLTSPDGQPAYISRVNLPDMPEYQIPAHSPVGSGLDSDGIYRDDVPDLDSQTSVFPSSISTCSPHTQRDTGATYSDPPVPVAPTILPPLPTTPWDAPHSHSTGPSPVSLPSINPPMKHFGTDPGAATPYAFNFTPPTYPHCEPSPALSMQPYPVSPYTNLHPHLAHHSSAQHARSQPHTPISVVGAPDSGMGSSPHPYYFDY